MKIFSRLCLLLAVTFFLSFAARAQAPISEEKRKLIAQLVVLMKLDDQMTSITDEILREMEKTYPLGFAEAVDARNDLTPRQKDLLKATAKERYLSFSRRFRERLPQVVDYNKYIEESIFPLYGKFYTEQELRDLVAFYQTPTGHKVIDTMPQLFAESLQVAREKLYPQIAPLLQELVEEDHKSIGVPKVSPPPNGKRRPAN